MHPASDRGPVRPLIRSRHRFLGAVLVVVALVFTASPALGGGTPPGMPTNVIAKAGNASAIVSWTPPSSTFQITSYDITTSPGGAVTTVGGDAMLAGVVGLTNGQPYTFTVQASSIGGTGPASNPSSAVTPKASSWSQVFECDAGCSGDVTKPRMWGGVVLPAGGPPDVVVSLTLSRLDPPATPGALVPAGCSDPVCLDVSVEPSDAFSAANPIKVIMTLLARGLKPAQREVFKDSAELEWCTTKGVLDPLPACINSISKTTLKGKPAHKVVVLATSADPRYRTR